MSEGLERRDFLKVLGVGSAGAAVTGCSTESAEKLLPYVVPPEEITPGVATWYATVDGDSPHGYGLWVRTREGRAVHVEGNPNHPVNGGALGTQGHAALQHLYNPDRFTGPMQRVNGQLQPISWEQAEQLLAARIRDSGGNFVFLHGHTGPSLGSLIAQVSDAAGGTHLRHESMEDLPLREAARIAFGIDETPHYNIGAARFLISFGADFLGSWGASVENTRGFTAMHQVDEHGSKGHFVFIGPRLSVSGQNADEWFPIQPGSEAVVALSMANVIAREGGDAGPYASLLSAYDPQAASAASGIPAEDIEALARRFMADGPGLALGPGVQGHHRGATAANLAVLVLNAVAGAVGRTLTFGGAASPAASHADVVSAMTAAAGGVVAIRGVNPAYSQPLSSGFTEAFARAGFKVSFASFPDETTSICDLVLPDCHFLESWGDANPRPGLYAVQQPVMQPVPLYDSRSTGDVLVSVLRQVGQDTGAADFKAYIETRWGALYNSVDGSGNFSEIWREALRVGFVEWGGSAPLAPSLQPANAALSFDAPALDGDAAGMTLSVYPSPRFLDGRWSNSPWLQELPDPVSKLMWQSWLEVNPHTAEELGVRDGDIVRVASPHGSLEVPVWTYPGIRRDTVAIATGGGHTDYGRWATGQGVNAVELLSGETELASGAMLLMSTRVEVTPTGEWKRPVTVAGATSDQGRPIAPAIALADLGHAEEEDHGGGHGLYELQELGGFRPVETDGEPEAFPLAGADYGPYSDPNTPRWAMTIDLDKCTGCSACVTACQSENNIAWVGEGQAQMGRELHWMRIETYYSHIDAEHAGHVDVRRVPMLCQHCGNAPCEPVCPVFAAYHTPDGLNGQIYNRCVGTRYCANNCPYKVRVFNWYRYAQEIPEPMNWQFNPDVTVRANGVMEKCTFCVQRIRDVQNRAVVEDRAVMDEEIKPACQVTCPAGAIVFGNIRDHDSVVYRATDNERTYRVLDALINTQPAVSYLKKVTHHEVAQAEH